MISATEPVINKTRKAFLDARNRPTTQLNKLNDELKDVQVHLHTTHPCTNHHHWHTALHDAEHRGRAGPRRADQPYVACMPSKRPILTHGLELSTRAESLKANSKEYLKVSDYTALSVACSLPSGHKEPGLAADAT